MNGRRRYHRMPRSSRGVTLVEILIALVIGLILVAGATEIFLTSKQTYRSTEALSRIQEAGRSALVLMARDIRQAGFWGCSREAEVTNMLNTTSGGPYDLIGQEGVTAEENPGGSPNGSDSVTLRYATSTGDVVAPSVPAKTSASLTVNDTTNIYPNDILLLTDCRNTNVFQATTVSGKGSKASLETPAPTRWASLIHGAIDTVISPALAKKGKGNGNGKSTITHNTGNSKPGNSTKQFTGPFPNGAQVLTVRTVEYAVQQNAGRYQLMRTFPGGSASAIAEGVREMQLQYGFDGDGDGIAEYYGNADEGDSADIVTVRIRLLVQSRDTSVTTGQQTVNFAGNNVAIPNGRLAQVFTATIAVRNRLP